MCVGRFVRSTFKIVTILSVIYRIYWYPVYNNIYLYAHCTMRVFCSKATQKLVSFPFAHILCVVACFFIISIHFCIWFYLDCNFCVYNIIYCCNFNVSYSVCLFVFLYYFNTVYKWTSLTANSYIYIFIHAYHVSTYAIWFFFFVCV